MRIGLYGIYGTYNFGCEAIVRGACDFIRRAFPEGEIVYFSYAYDYDKKALSDLNIEIYCVSYTRNAIRKGVNRIVSAINPNNQLLLIDYKKMLSGVDMIFSIGGDIYTIPEVIRKQGKYNYYNTLVNFCNKAIANGKDVIVYGASVGPWGDYQPAVDYYTNSMKKYRAILCREETSVDYLNSLGFSNVQFFPDPAFQVKCLLADPVERKYIGINFSLLSFYEVFGQCGEEIVNQTAQLLDDIYRTYQIDLLLIPHVISNSDIDNDFYFLNKLRDRMTFNSHVFIAKHDKGFLGIKKKLRECHLVVSARMHCAINAIVENIPAIFISYSQKSRGMCEYVYGNQEYIIGLKEINNELIGKIGNVLSKKEGIEKQLRCRNAEICRYYDEKITQIL